jgi:hypothetical protein
LNKQYTINFETAGDHLVVTIPEISVTVETAAGEITRDAATAAAQRAIIAHLEAKRKRRPRRHDSRAKAS